MQLGHTTKSSHFGAQLQTMHWIIDARWYYAFAAYMLGLVAKDEAGLIIPTTIALTVGLIGVFIFNLIFFWTLRQEDRDHKEARSHDVLNVLQIALDLAFFFFVILMTGGGVTSIGHSFFFIPIIVSTIIFGFRGSVAVAVLSGFLILISVLANAGVLAPMLLSGERIGMTSGLSVALAQSAIISIIYLMTAFFGAYISRLIKARDVLLLEQIQKEENQVTRLEELTKEYDKGAKLLVRRDLELTSANEKLTQLDRMKSEIVSIVAHQLRTPLSAIKWTLKILLDEDMGKVTKEQQELISKAFDSNERMIGLVNDMLAVDRLESGKIKYNFVPVQFEQIVKELVQSLEPLTDTKGIQLELILPNESLPSIKIDPDKMRDVLQNLIDNAIKYTGEKGEVVVGVEKNGELLHFWVKDNGIGIPEEEKDKIFSRFFRAANAVHSQTNGSGLGLFIASSVVKRHGGKIWFESALNEGTTFHVEMPFMA